MNNREQPRKWYKKKRYIIPILILGFILFNSSGDSNPATDTPKLQSNVSQIITQPEIKLLAEPVPKIEIAQPKEEIKVSEPSKDTVKVKGYYRKDGTYVQPYYRSNTEEVLETSEAPSIQFKKEYIPEIETTQSPQKQNCHPSYSGCLKPDASDYDCAGGSGNGPYYTGKVRVIGPDVFRLDRDGDGWGCE